VRIPLKHKTTGVTASLSLGIEFQYEAEALIHIHRNTAKHYTFLVSSRFETHMKTLLWPRPEEQASGVVISDVAEDCGNDVTNIPDGRRVLGVCMQKDAALHFWKRNKSTTDAIIMPAAAQTRAIQLQRASKFSGISPVRKTNNNGLH
jgi:hypothetical protein